MHISKKEFTFFAVVLAVLIGLFVSPMARAQTTLEGLNAVTPGMELFVGATNTLAPNVEVPQVDLEIRLAGWTPFVVGEGSARKALCILGGSAAIGSRVDASSAEVDPEGLASTVTGAKIRLWLKREIGAAYFNGKEIRTSIIGMVGAKPVLSADVEPALAREGGLGIEVWVVGSNARLQQFFGTDEEAIDLTILNPDGTKPRILHSITSLQVPLPNLKNAVWMWADATVAVFGNIEARNDTFRVGFGAELGSVFSLIQ